MTIVVFWDELWYNSLLTWTLYHAEESANCVVLKFERLDVHHEGSVTLYGVECGTIADARIVCEARRGNITF